ncbi:MAG: Imm27 family immunity protein [Acidobacteriota bacterium]|jgi:hypothetical protein|nr:Imm27 family immunity protein [Acidobacteriota bacterium]
MIRSHETEIIGNWIEVEEGVVGDEKCKRIEWLTSEYLKKIGFSSKSGGWNKLFQDPLDKRFWEQTYPHGDWHGGGPPALVNISQDEAIKKYPELFEKE